MSGPDGMPGRRRAHRRPFEESATLLGASDEGVENDAGQDASGSGAQPDDADIARVVGGAHTAQARPAARPATRAPALPSGPVLPRAERPPARPPGARRADRPTLVGPDPHAAPAGRRIAAPPDPGPDRAPTAAPAPVPEPAPEPAPEPPREPAPAQPASSAPVHDEAAAAPQPVQADARHASAQQPPRASTPPPPTSRRAAPAAPVRSRERTRGWLGERPAQTARVATAPTPSALPTPAADPRPAVAPVRRRVSDPEAERARERYSSRVRPSGPEKSRLFPGAVALWVLAVAVAAAGILISRGVSDVPAAARLGCAAVIAVALALALAVRTGGRPLWAVGLSGTLVLAACVTGWHPLLAGASVGTGTMAATLAVMVTTPAARFANAIREALVATVIAAAGSIGVIGFGPHARPEVSVDRLGYVVLGLSLASAFALVYRLGAGLHGLGRRGYAVAAGAVIMLALALAYSEAFAQWGSRDLIRSLDDLRGNLRSSLGAVPHPMAALLGYPALLWGVFMRARRRQGWWVTAFGVAATAPTATRLVAADAQIGSVVLGMLYSLLVGGVIGYLVIRLEQVLTGSHGRRARRDEEAVAHRPEPGRTHPLH